MPYGSTMRRSNRFTGGSPNVSNTRFNNPSYSTAQTGIWRHQRVNAAPDAGSANALTTNNFFGVSMLSCKMTFDGAGTTLDVPPTATASNNFSNVRMFNGSKCEDYSAVLRIKNNDDSVRYLDVYQITTSFLNVTDWVTVMGQGLVPVTQNITTPAGTLGEVNFQSPTAGIIDAQSWSDYLTQQRNLVKLGTITLGNSSSGDGTVELNFTDADVPSKCRRANYGMFWGLCFHNDPLKNGVVTMNTSFNKDVSFTEIPSSYRIPFKQ